VTFPNIRLSLLSAILLLTTQACAQLPGKKGCEQGVDSIVPSRDLKHVVLHGFRLCGQGMVTSADTVIMLVPSSQLDLEHLDQND
jgi:hypothetical protein